MPWSEGMVMQMWRGRRPPGRSVERLVDVERFRTVGDVLQGLGESSLEFDVATETSLRLAPAFNSTP
jgi:hypothetical protein